MAEITKIALEEHVLDAGQDPYFRMLAGPNDHFGSAAMTAVMARLTDVDTGRLADMDALGIKTAILSYYNGASPQLDPDRVRAVMMAQRLNAFLAERIAAHPGRFMGWATLAMQDVPASIAELRRCMTIPGFAGALINGQTQGDYLDLPKYLPFWEAVAELDVPIYLHPGILTPEAAKAYEGYPGLAGPGWGWGADTGLHALRLIFSGLFDRFPNLTLILGHMGELIPFHLDRADQIWMQTGAQSPKLPISHYVAKNIMVTTSGNVSAVSLIGTTLAIGADRILYATDYPLALAERFTAAVENSPLSAADREKIFHGNARKLFKL
ncbi:amidohydrolase family protein [Lichenihabitans psoromatis]|uniref:amidohydrolase family protein n=1 Tax=Lichenihabitans psoromatis TaxID=2528642 RepID=UPI00103849D5|nr:amidohydrolase family protein [Lichenihabitans psoromatis]